MSVVKGSRGYTRLKWEILTAYHIQHLHFAIYKIGMQLMYQVGCGLRKYWRAMHIYSWMSVLTKTISVIHTMNPTIVVVIDKYALCMVTNYQKLKEHLPELNKIEYFVNVVLHTFV